MNGFPALRWAASKTKQSSSQNVTKMQRAKAVSSPSVRAGPFFRVATLDAGAEAIGAHVSL